MGEDYTDIFNISNEQQEQVLVDCKENLKGYEDRYEIIRATSEKCSNEIFR
jgi:hypothetical protein